MRFIDIIMAAIVYF